MRMSWNLFSRKRVEEPPKDSVHDISEPNEEIPLRCICAVMSDTDKEENQDACGSFYDEITGITVLAVADGIGSNKHVATGSRFVTDKVLELIDSYLQDGLLLDFTRIFAKVQEELTAMVNQVFADQIETINRKDFGSTLIVAVDTPDTFTLAYVGNGCAYYMMGDFVQFPKNNYLPWKVNNLLVPHSLPDEITGQETLCKYFSYKPVLVDQCVPTVITVSKNHHAGELLIIGTDGVDSLDKHDEFAFNHNELMMTSSWSMSLLCDRIKKTLETASVINEDSLYQMLDKYMITLRNENRMEDDVTLGILMSPKVFHQDH
jgi:hypothetical protein